MRLGYVVAPPPLLDRILARRHDAGPNTLSAAITTEYLGPDLWGHVERANTALRVKRDAMLAALETHLGNQCSWSRPVGGLFIWVRLPDGLDVEALAADAAARGVAFKPGSEYHVAGSEVPFLRLAFGFPDAETIETGIARLGERHPRRDGPGGLTAPSAAGRGGCGGRRQRPQPTYQGSPP